MHTTVHTQRLVGHLVEVAPGLRDMTLRDEAGAQLHSQLTFLDRHSFRLAEVTVLSDTEQED